MLSTKAYSLNDVVTFKLANGEELISRISEERTTDYLLNKPMALVAAPNGGLGLAPALFTNDPSKPVVLNKSAVTLHCPTIGEFATQYMEKTSGLTIVKNM